MVIKTNIRKENEYQTSDMVLNGCDDGSSNKSPETQNEQEVNNADTTKAPVITLIGKSLVMVGHSFAGDTATEFVDYGTGSW